MSAIAVDAIFEFAKLLARSSASLAQGAPVQTILCSVVSDLQPWLQENGFKDSIESLKRFQDSDPSRSEVAQELYGMGTRLCELTDRWEVRETISGMHRRLLGIIQQPSPTPPMVSGIFLSEATREITSDLVKRQMLEMLALYVASVMHNAAHSIAPIHMRINKTKKEWERLQALAEQNKGLLPEEPSARMMDYLAVIGRHVDDINRLVIRTAEMIRGVQNLGLRDSSPIPPEAIAHLFEESGKMTQINFTLMEILQGLLEVDQNIEHLNEMAKEYGHYVPPETLQQGVDFLANISRDVRTFRGSVTRIAALFLSLWKLKEGMKDLSPAPMDLHDHLDEGMLKDLMGKGIQAFFKRDDDSWPILAVSPYVWLVIVNLLVNARQAMKEDTGQLWISTQKTTLDTQEAQTLSEEHPNRILPTAQEGEYMVLRIRDSGPGIPSHILPEIFRPGFSSKKSSGLGLSVLLNLVEGMKGFLVLETWTQGSGNGPPGTAFSIYFPRAS